MDWSSWFSGLLHDLPLIIGGIIMKKNMGIIDRTMRTLLAVVVGVLYYLEIISGTIAIVLGILAVVFLITSFIGTCPLYLPFGLSTKIGE